LRFKSVFIFFTLIILVFLVFVTLIPFLMFEPSVAGLFWRTNWPFILILALILGGIDLFYLANRRLFSLLEREDWPALVNYLEGRVIRRQRYQPQLVRLLANTCLVLADVKAVTRLENRLAQAKPALLRANALVFGVARILGKDLDGAVRFFAGRLEDPRGGASRSWLRWYYGFSLYLNRQLALAADQFVPLAEGAREALPAGLAAHFLAGPLHKALPDRREEFEQAAAAGRERVRKALPRPGNWNKEVLRLKTEIHAAVLAKYFEEAGTWLYGQEGSP
jgi:hypothetical protein